MSALDPTGSDPRESDPTESDPTRIAQTDIDLPGLWNLREPLPGLFRSEAPDRLDGAGWAALVARGVHTVVDLRSADEVQARPVVVPPEVRRVWVGLEDGLQSHDLVRGWFETGHIGTPLYYGPFCAQWPERAVRAVAAVEAAHPGVLVHCAKGCDRTGMVLALVLDRWGVDRQRICADYLHTRRRQLRPAARSLGVPDDQAQIDAVMARAGMSLAGSLCAFLDAGWGARLGAPK